MKIKTTRFGELEVDKKDIINFTEGILGFENLKEFFVVDPNDQTLILWLQSTKEGATAFPIIEPKIFMPDYSVERFFSELGDLDLKSANGVSIYTILTIPQDVTKMSANLKAPIVINNKTRVARQIIFQDSKLEVRHAMYKDLKKSIVNYASDDSVRTKTEAGESSVQKIETSLPSPPLSKTGATSEA